MDYHHYLLLSLFDNEKLMKINQMATIVSGKRTGSTLYQALSHDKLHVFNIFPYLNRDNYNYIINAFIKKGWLIEENKGYALLSNKGDKLIKDYFSKRDYPDSLNNLNYGNGWKEFFQRLILIVQVMSEYIYDNTAYQPIVNNINTQYFIKKWVNYSSLNDNLVERFYAEIYGVLSLLKDTQAQIITENFTGYHHIGKTSSDLQDKFDLTKSAYNFNLMNTVHRLLNIIESNNRKFPLLFDIWHRTDFESYQGLSKSSAETYHFIKNGLSFQHIANIKNVKVSTIKDQLIEIAITIEDFPIDYFVSDKESILIKTYLSETDDLRFKRFSEAYPNIPFYKFRLIQIQEIRVTS